MDLSEFINARLAETEKIARQVRPPSLYAYEEGGGDGWAVEGTDGSPGAIIGDRALAIHIARWDPAHVMAWCAAIRAVVHQSWSAMDDPWTYDMMARYLAKEALLEFARIWSAHPDFNPAWRRV